MRLWGARFSDRLRTFYTQTRAARTRAQRGFTIVDTILMMMIVGIGLSGIIMFFANTNREVLDSNFTVMASALAQERVEQVVADRGSQGYAAVTQNTYPAEPNMAAPFAGFSRTTTVTEVDPANPNAALVGSGLKRIDVQVAWNGGQTVSLSTMVGNW